MSAGWVDSSLPAREWRRKYLRVDVCGEVWLVPHNVGSPYFDVVTPGLLSAVEKLNSVRVGEVVELTPEEDRDYEAARGHQFLKVIKGGCL